MLILKSSNNNRITTWIEKANKRQRKTEEGIKDNPETLVKLSTTQKEDNQYKKHNTVK